MEKEDVKNNKREFPNSIWDILIYFYVYSFLGFILETLFGVLVRGVLESRQSMLYGPFCCIYGLGAVCLICIPKKVKNNNILLFIYGMIVGSLIEYVVSYLGEIFFHIRWWDYSDLPYNINGRVCLLFSVFWGICTLVLNNFFNPTISKWKEKIKEKYSIKLIHTILIVLAVLFVIDNLVSSFALKMFFTRIIYNYNIDNVSGVEEYYDDYLDLYLNNKTIKNIVDKFFSDKIMIKAFPNIKIMKNDGSIIWIKDILKDIKPYYIEIFKPSNNLLTSKIN